MKNRTAPMTSETERLRFRDYYGTGTMGMMEALTSSLMSSFFMQYLTDYSGLGSWAASLGTALLVFARVFDAVNDPFEAWIMDRAKPGKHGKYRPFVFLSILLQFIGVACLFFIPTIENKIVVAIWVIGFYLVYDIGYSFYSPEVLYRSMTNDDSQRAKLMIPPRVITMFMGMLVATLISVVAALNVHFNDYHTAFGVAVLVYLVMAGVLAVSGTMCVKERYIAEKGPDEEPAKLTDAFAVLRDNKPVRVRIIAGIFGGMMYNLLFSTANYYVKWAYCADLATGAVDTARYGTMTLITSMMMFIPLIIGTAIAMPIMNRLGAIRFTRMNLLVESVAFACIALGHFTGLFRVSPIPFFACMAVCAIAMGSDFIPGGALNMECMDYEVYKNGRDRAATINVLGRLLTKAQSALSTAGVGAVLVAIGYVVDSATDTYLGELSALPTMMNWFIILMGAIPAVLGIIAWLIYGAYPIDDQLRREMKAALKKQGE